LPAGQKPLAQSFQSVHDLPMAQPEQVPPQSTSVSVPFLTASMQVGAWQTPPEQERV
jgi:hypothetical protein